MSLKNTTFTVLQRWGGQLVRYDNEQYNNEQYNSEQYNSEQYNSEQYNIEQYNIKQCLMLDCILLLEQFFQFCFAGLSRLLLQNVISLKMKSISHF